MGIAFTKLHGIGNDYVFVDGHRQALPDDPAALAELARAISDRHRGVGGDGLILILPPRDPAAADFRMRIFNADGSEGEMCGNGMRCFARYVYDHGLTRKTALAVETGAGLIRPELRLDADGRVEAVRVDMGPPRLARRQIPMRGPDAPVVLDEPLAAAGGEGFRVCAVSMGNPHAVIFVADPAALAAVDLARVGPLLERHPAFPERANIHFAVARDPAHITMRTWERGSGITQACGTGACAVLVAAASSGRAARRARVELPGGELDVEWSEADGHIYMTGPATEVFSGVYAPR